MSAVRTSVGKLDIVAISVRDADNVLQSVTAGFVRNAANALKAFFATMTAAVSKTSLTGYASSSSSQAITTTAVTASAVGGVGPYTYAWEAADAVGWTINSPTSSQTTFTSPAMPAYEGEIGTFRCLVTDATGAEAYTPLVFAQVTNLGGSGGLIP